MAVPHTTLLALNSVDSIARVSPEQHDQRLLRDIEIENSKLLVLNIKQMRFGRKSEKLDQQVAQLELCLEELESVPPPSVAAVRETVVRNRENFLVGPTTLA